MNILVVDVGGTHVKCLATGMSKRKFASGPDLTAVAMVEGVRDLTKDWHYDCLSIGYPGPVLAGKPVAEPHNLGPGWVGYDYEKAFGRPVRIINDAAMQALGAYDGGNMLFLGLGTGLGSAMIVGGFLQPMELGHLPYKKRTYEDYVGRAGLERYGRKKWERLVHDIVERLKAALAPDYVVLGGGNAGRLKELPEGCRLGSNTDAFRGGFRLWETDRVQTGSASRPRRRDLARRGDDAFRVDAGGAQ